MPELPEVETSKRYIEQFLLNAKMTKVDSFEIVKLNDLILRHFVTNDLNELYEDENGSIYVSADKSGIHKLSFLKFR